MLKKEAFKMSENNSTSVGAAQRSNNPSNNVKSPNMSKLNFILKFADAFFILGCACFVACIAFYSISLARKNFQYTTLGSVLLGSGVLILAVGLALFIYVHRNMPEARQALLVTRMGQSIRRSFRRSFRRSTRRHPPEMQPQPQPQPQPPPLPRQQHRHPRIEQQHSSGSLYPPLPPVDPAAEVILDPTRWNRNRTGHQPPPPLQHARQQPPNSPQPQQYPQLHQRRQQQPQAQPQQQHRGTPPPSYYPPQAQALPSSGRTPPNYNSVVPSKPQARRPILDDQVRYNPPYNPQFR